MEDVMTLGVCLICFVGYLIVVRTKISVARQKIWMRFEELDDMMFRAHLFGFISTEQLDYFKDRRPTKEDFDLSIGGWHMYYIHHILQLCSVRYYLPIYKYPVTEIWIESVSELLAPVRKTLQKIDRG